MSGVRTAIVDLIANAAIVDLVATTPTVDLVQALDDTLPQTQCSRCGYPDCRSYAEAIARDAAPINQCPPGGAQGVARLSALTGRPALALNPQNGLEGPRGLAVIDEAWCIGCTLCLKACPVDCIVGGPKGMHTVIDHLCTGCELCLPVCPVDCISLVPAAAEGTGWRAWSEAQADVARSRYRWHRDRMQRDAEARLEPPPAPDKTTAVAAALVRARAARPPDPT